MQIRETWRRILRWGVWLFVVFLLVRGIASFFPASPAAANPPAAAKVAVEPAGLRAFPAMFAREYLTWQPGDVAERTQRLQPYLARNLDAQAGWSGAEATGQRVLEAWTYSVKQMSDTRWQVTVAALVQPEKAPQAATLFLAVPVAVTGGGGLTVYDYPSLLPAPQGGAFNEPLYHGSEEADENGSVKALLTDFFKAYFSSGETAYFLTANTQLPALRTPWRFAGVTRVVLLKTDDGEWALADVAAQDPVTTASFTYRYTVKLARKDGRWFISDMLQKGE